MPLELQVKLLRVLETGACMRVGGERADRGRRARHRRDATAIPSEAVEPTASCARTSSTACNVFPIALPPLRERERRHRAAGAPFPRRDARSSEGNDEAAVATRRCDALRRYAWPGNVRELKNVVQRAFILADTRSAPTLASAESRRRIGRRPCRRPTARSTSTSACRIAEAERRLILATLDAVRRRQEAAAEVLGVSLKTLYNRLNEYRA